MEVSVVIPTRNRRKSLQRLLASLARQTYPLREVIVVDASDEPLSEQALQATFPNLPLSVYSCQPSVCIQRNRGIRRAGAPYVFLCDDDIEAPPTYVAGLMTHLRDHPSCGAVSGLWLQRDAAGNWTGEFPIPTFRQLLWNFVFQLGVWSDLERVSGNFLTRLPLGMLRRWYARRGNTLTLAGWPLLTAFRQAVFHTTIYSLGAAIVRREWLLRSPFAEVLDRGGIGDNYGVILGFPAEPALAVLTDAPVFHHHSPHNREAYPLVYYRRILALHFFIKTKDRFGPLNRAFLVWSLLGNYLAQTLGGRGELARATRKALQKIISGKNPYLLASREPGKKVVCPELD